MKPSASLTTAEVEKTKDLGSIKARGGRIDVAEPGGGRGRGRRSGTSSTGRCHRTRSSTSGHSSETASSLPPPRRRRRPCSPPPHRSPPPPASPSRVRSASSGRAEGDDGDRARELLGGEARAFAADSALFKLGIAWEVVNGDRKMLSTCRNQTVRMTASSER